MAKTFKSVNAFALLSQDDDDDNGDDRAIQIDAKKVSMLKKIKKLLVDYDFHGNWILDEKVFKEEVHTVFSNMCRGLADEKLALKEAAFRNSVIALIGRKFVQLFLGIYLEKSEVDQYIAQTKKLIDKCWTKEYLEPTYFPGIFHVFYGLQALHISKRPVSESSFVKIKTALNEIRYADKLDDKGQVGLLAVHAKFISEMQKGCFKEQAEHVQKMIALEPNCGEWKHWLYNIYHFHRQQLWDFELPGNDLNAPAFERALIVDAVVQSPTNPFILISLCENIADFVYEHGPDWIGVEDFGPGRSFTTSEEMTKYLKTASRLAVAYDPTSAKINSIIARMFSAVLPSKLKDFDFSNICIDRALLFHPESSRPNHRKGIICLKKEKNPKKAVAYFEQAVRSNRANFPAASDLLQTYFHDHEANAKNIEELFNNNFVWDNCSGPNLRRVEFIKGVYLFLKLDFSVAIDKWVVAVQENKTELDHFTTWNQSVWRYHWPTHLLGSHVIKRRLTLTLESEVEDGKKETLKEILSSLDQNLMTKYSVYDPDGTRGREHVLQSNGSNSKNWRSHARQQNSGNQVTSCSGHGGAEASWRKPNSNDPTFPSSGQRIRLLSENYATLGLKSGVSIDEINKAYVKLCRNYCGWDGKTVVHRNRDQHLEKMMEINSAHEALVKAWN